MLQRFINCQHIPFVRDVTMCGKMATDVQSSNCQCVEIDGELFNFQIDKQEIHERVSMNEDTNLCAMYLTYQCKRKLTNYNSSRKMNKDTIIKESASERMCTQHINYNRILNPVHIILLAILSLLISGSRFMITVTAAVPHISSTATSIFDRGVSSVDSIISNSYINSHNNHNGEGGGRSSGSGSGSGGSSSSSSNSNADKANDWAKDQVLSTASFNSRQQRVFVENNSIHRSLKTSPTLTATIKHEPPNRSLKRVFLSNRTVVCNDGTLAGFYLRKNLNSKKWIVFLEGGWHCYDSKSCRSRWTRLRHLMTSSQWPETRDVGGILSPLPDENPYWHNANHVLVPYCSSDSWSGTRAKPNSSELNFRFMGALILQQVIIDLIPLGLGRVPGSELLLVGSSAGGLGVMLNIDRITHYLQQDRQLHITVRGISDSGWFLDREPYTPTGVASSEAVHQGWSMWQGLLPEKCVREHILEPWRCYFGYRLYPTLRAPIFVFQWLFDEAQMRADNVAAPVTPHQWNYIHAMGGALRSSLDNVSAVFAPSCIGHAVLSKREWLTIKIDDISLPMALRCWEHSTRPRRRSPDKLKRSTEATLNFNRLHNRGHHRQHHRQNRHHERHQTNSPSRNLPNENFKDNYLQRVNNHKERQRMRHNRQRERSANRRNRLKNSVSMSEPNDNVSLHSKGHRRHRHQFESEIESVRFNGKKSANRQRRKQRRHRQREPLNLHQRSTSINDEMHTQTVTVYGNSVEHDQKVSNSGETMLASTVNDPKRRHNSINTKVHRKNGVPRVPERCSLRLMERCSWPQCNHSCPTLTNPATGEEMRFLELLASFGLDMEAVAAALGVDMHTLNNMDRTELVNLLTQQVS